MAKRGPKSMSDEHKAALATGRAESRAVKDYLEALESARPKRGRRRTPESIDKRLGAIEDQIGDADPLKRLNLIQERNDLQSERSQLTEETDTSELEAAFVKVAQSYSERKGIEYSSWREMGVPAATLKEAGIGRGS